MHKGNMVTITIHYLEKQMKVYMHDEYLQRKNHNHKPKGKDKEKRGSKIKEKWLIQIMQDVCLTQNYIVCEFVWINHFMNFTYE